MPFGIKIGEDGKPVCPCCRDTLWHCFKCWKEHHNSHDGKDYTPPTYYGQSMMDEEMTERLEKDFGIKYNPSIKPDKGRLYMEGEYHG